ncbi:hypothetical protein QR98_0105170, partial [Sarcoptes scabiei]
RPAGLSCTRRPAAPSLRPGPATAPRWRPAAQTPPPCPGSHPHPTGGTDSPTPHGSTPRETPRRGRKTPPRPGQTAHARYRGLPAYPAPPPGDRTSDGPDSSRTPLCRLRSGRAHPGRDRSQWRWPDSA